MRIVDIPLALRTNEPRLLSSLRDYFAPYLSDRPASDAHDVFVIQGERSRYASLRTEELWTVEQKHDVDVDAIYGPGTFHLQGRLRAIFLLRWSPLDRGWNVRTLGAVERQAALAQLVKRVGVYDIVHSQTDEAHAVRAVAHSVSMYEVTGQADVSRLTDLVLADAR
jgi:hypothetical protein